MAKHPKSKSMEDFLPSCCVTLYCSSKLILSTPAIAHDIEGKPFVTGGVDDGEVTDSAEILDSEGDLWLPYEHANVSIWLRFVQF